MKVKLILRKSSSDFHSIENVFNAISGQMNVDVIHLPYESKGVLNRIKNIFYLLKFKNCIFHISGHDHYLLWFPFPRTILTIHDIESLNRKVGFKKWLFRKLWFEIPMKRAKAITTISSFTKLELNSLNFGAVRIEVIPNPMSLALEYHQKSMGPIPRILHIGTKPNKNLNRLLEAMQGLKVHLTIIGTLKESQLDLISIYGLDTSILFDISNDEMVNEYRKCDMVSFVSTYEGFGLPIIEAQSIGRPVLSSNLSSMPEVAGAGAYFVNPYDVKEIRTGILELVSNANLRNDLVAKGLENVKRYNPGYIADKYKRLYQEIRHDK